MSGVASARVPRILAVLGMLLLATGGLCEAAKTVSLRLADGFDFPVGPPNAAGYYKARGMRLRSPIHYGEDWNGRGGGNTDLGAPVYSIADGIVTWAYDVKGGWGNVMIIRYAYRDPKSGRVRYCDALYGHLRNMYAKAGQQVKRGQKVGTIGSNRGMYAAHLHFEIRYNLATGMQRESVGKSLDNWADPTVFINKYRRLNREWRKHPVPVGTYREYKGFKGL